MEAAIAAFNVVWFRRIFQKRLSLKGEEWGFALRTILRATRYLEEFFPRIFGRAKRLKLQAFLRV